MSLQVRITKQSLCVDLSERDELARSNGLKDKLFFLKPLNSQVIYRVHFQVSRDTFEILLILY